MTDTRKPQGAQAALTAGMREQVRALISEAASEPSDLAKALDRIGRALEVLRPPASPTDLTPPQRRLALTYNAFRTLLGRQGSAAIISAARGGPGNDAGDVLSLRGPIPSTRITVVAYGSDGAEIGRDPEHRRDGELRYATIPGLRDEMTISRIEILDEDCQPILLGPGLGPFQPSAQPAQRR
jgi:hypothetical protein